MPTITFGKFDESPMTEFTNAPVFVDGVQMGTLTRVTEIVGMRVYTYAYITYFKKHPYKEFRVRNSAHKALAEAKRHMVATLTEVV